MALNPKQEAFARFYAESHDGKGSAEKAGYAASCSKVTACKLLKKPEVRARVDEILAVSFKENAVSLESIASELAKIFFHNLDLSDMQWTHKIQAGGLMLRVYEIMDFAARLDRLEGLVEKLGPGTMPNIRFIGPGKNEDEKPETA